MNYGPRARFERPPADIRADGFPAAARPFPDSSVVNHTTTSILIVEDQDDVRRMLSTALTLEGHHTEVAASAAEGLERLKTGRYQLVLSDYAMPGGTGSWMLQEATRLGLLEHTAAVIITAHPDIERIPGIAVIAKPLDLDDFLEQVQRLLITLDERERLILDGPHPYRVELVLYVTLGLAASQHARAAVERVLTEFDSSQIHYTVHDLAREPLAGVADRVTFTPTLVRRYPSPQVWLLGSIRDPLIVWDLLRSCGVDAG